MNRMFIVGIIVGVFVAGMFLPGLVNAAIPPTPAWVDIASNDTDSSTNPSWANSTNYDGDLWIITDGSILIEIIDYQGGAE